MNREDIYNIVVPIAIAIIGTLGTYFFHNINETKQWKIKRRKSPRDKGIEYLVRVIVLGFLFLVFSVLVVEYIRSSIGLPLLVGIGIGIVLYIGLFIFLYIVMKRTSIDDKEIFVKDMAEYKKEKSIRLLRQIPIILSGLFWGSTIQWMDFVSVITGFIGKTVFQFISNILSYIPIATAIAWIVYYYICMKFLKGEGEFLYDRVKFAFYDNSILDNIKVEDVSQNRSWIIAKNQENMEYRFKVKDIKTIKYSNFENQTECEQ